MDVGGTDMIGQTSAGATATLATGAHNAAATPQTDWPGKRDLFGVSVSVTWYADAIERIITAGKARQAAIVDLMPVHSLVTAATDSAYRQKLNQFDMVCPDGQPVRWALNLFHKAGLTDRVYGPELMWRTCAAAEKAGVAIYLYGASPAVVQTLAEKIGQTFAGLKIAGVESPPFRPLTAEEDAAVVERINASGAGIVFLGTGCPRQEIFAFEHRPSIRAVQLCVGAAFDFHAGQKKMAPSWMQKRGLEWLFRLSQEPGRLWKRYLVTNTIFSLLFARRLLLGR